MRISADALKRLAKAAVPIVLLAAALIAIAYRPHNTRCRLEPVLTPTGQPKLEHVAKSSGPDGFRVISPSINCGKCHDPKVHTLIP
jgi:hypothetical protein